MLEPTPASLTADDLLAGAAQIFEITVPAHLLATKAPPPEGHPLTVQLRPLTIGTFQLIMKATRQDPGLVPLLMIKESLVSPALSLEQVRAMPLGLVNFFIGHIRQISGLGEKKT